MSGRRPTGEDKTTGRKPARTAISVLLDPRTVCPALRHATLVRDARGPCMHMLQSLKPARLLHCLLSDPATWTVTPRDRDTSVGSHQFLDLRDILVREARAQDD